MGAAEATRKIVEIFREELTVVRECNEDISEQIMAAMSVAEKRGNKEYPEPEEEGKQKEKDRDKMMSN